MSPKGGGAKGSKGKSKGKHPGPVGAGGLERKGSGRQTISDEVITGRVHIWRQQWGWIIPTVPIDHPQAHQNGGRIFMHLHDAKRYEEIEAVSVGSVVEFSVYCDAKGLGAQDWGIMEKSPGEDMGSSPPLAPEGEDFQASSGKRRGKGKGTGRKGHPGHPDEELVQAADPQDLEEEAAADDVDVPQPGDVEEEPLPEGWEAVWSEEHREWYYWHGATKTAAWTRPTESGGAGEEAEGEAEEEAVAVETADQVELDATAPDVEQDEEEADALEVERDSGIESAGKPKAAAPLPDGWEEHFDAEHGEWYYWHPLTKTTTWERPVEEPSTAQPQEPEKPAALESAQLLSKRRIQGRIAKWEGSFGWAVPIQDVSEELRPMLEQHEYKIYVSASDVEAGHKIAAGTKVDFLLYRDGANGLGAFEVRPLEVPAAGLNGGARALGSGMRAGAERPVLRDAGGGAGGGSSASAGGRARPQQPPEEQYQEQQNGDVIEAEEEAQPPMPAGWEEIWAEEHQCYYYWHAETRQSLWERPGASDAEAPAAEEEVEGVEEVVVEEEAAAAPQTLLRPSAKRSAAGPVPTQSPGKAKGRGVGTFTGATPMTPSRPVQAPLKRPRLA